MKDHQSDVHENKVLPVNTPQSKANRGDLMKRLMKIPLVQEAFQSTDNFLQHWPRPLASL